MKSSVFRMLAVITFLLAGCEEATPEPSKATCTGDAYRQILSEIGNEAKSEAFAEECGSFRNAEEMRDWEFKPSPKDDF